MENREEFLTEILRRVQRNYMHMIEIERLTKDMGDSMARNDKESMQLILKMRGEEMDKYGTAKREIEIILDTADAEEREKFFSWLKGETKYEPDEPETKKIAELSTKTRQLLKRTIDLDKVLNTKVAGTKSYYQAVTS